MLTRHDAPQGHAELTEDDVAIARVIGDVWLSALVGLVYNRPHLGRRRGRPRWTKGRPPAAPR
jgi:hypothetical protein